MVRTLAARLVILSLTALLLPVPLCRAQELKLRTASFGMEHVILDELSTSELSTGQLDEYGHQILSVQDVPTPSYGEPVLPAGDCADDPGYMNFKMPGRVFLLGELTFLRYHRADGTRVGTETNEQVEFGLELAPRISVGLVSPEGFGSRVRWWFYDHAANAEEEGGSALSVDTTVLDFEMFRVFRVCSSITCEWSVGMRYNEFTEQMVDTAEDDNRIIAFNGYGAVGGLELRQLLAHDKMADIWIFGRCRGAVLMDDKSLINIDNGTSTGGTLLDTTVAAMELTAGFEAARVVQGNILFVQFAGEWQNWFNYSAAFTDEETFLGPADVGFGGILFSVGATR